MQQVVSPAFRWACQAVAACGLVVFTTGHVAAEWAAASPNQAHHPRCAGYPVIVRYRPGYEPAAVAGVNGRLARRLALDHSVAVCLTGEQIRRLAASGAIESIEPDALCTVAREAAEAGFGTTKASADFGLSGDGDGDPTSYSPRDHTIAVIDTGIDGSHRDFAGGKIIAWKDFVNGRPVPYDDHGHGTHCASIAAGALNSAGVGGVAPGAALIGLKVLAADGSGSSSTIAQALEWCIANKQTYGISVISMSLAGAGSADGRDALCRSVNRAVAAGIVVCVAAGNAGPGAYTIGSPAAAADAITVGNMADPARGGFYLLPSSSRGPTADGRVKPDLCAPGCQILAAQANSGDGYLRMTGTSMACPFVAGVAALMLQANLGLSPRQVKATLKETAVHFGRDGENNEFGAGRLDAYAALARAAARTGIGPAGPSHVYHPGYLRGSGDAQSWDLTVTDTRYPLAATLIMETPGAHFNLGLYDPSGNLVAQSNGLNRQQQVSLMPATTGIYQLVARSAGGSGDTSLDVSAGTKLLSPPLAPRNLRAAAVSASQIRLTWTAGGSNETGCAVFRRSGAGAYALIAMGPPHTTAFIDSGLSANTTYTYRIRAYSASGVSPWGHEASAVTLPGQRVTRAAGGRAVARRCR